MKKRKEFIDRKKCMISILMVILTAIIVCFIGKVLNQTMKENVVSRVTDESEFLAKQQAELINKLLEEQYDKADTMSQMIEEGLSFYEEKNQPILKAFVDKNRLCMLGYADKNGEVINYKGERMGSISDRAYFSDIITGKKKFVCQYLSSTKAGDEPRIIFSTAVCRDGKREGVVFFSKEKEVLKENLFQQSMFEKKESCLIVDGKGNILVKNKRAEERYKSVDNIEDVYFTKRPINEFKGTKSGSMLCGRNKEQVLSYSTIEYNGWYLICIIDANMARYEYAENLVSIQKSILISSGLSVLLVCCVLMLIIMQIKKDEKTYKEYKMQYERIVSLLQKTKCMIMEYDIKSGKLTPNVLFEQMFGYGVKDDFFERIPEMKVAHPEFDFDGLLRALKYAIEHKVTTSFDGIYCPDRFTYRMLSIVMMPLQRGDGQVTNILGSIRETSMEHKQLKEKVDMVDQIPGGTYRYHLCGPHYLEYAGEKLCKMLGYTVEEFLEIVGTQYEKIIIEEDREQYKEFLKEASLTEGVRRCQYKIRCKNGDILAVLDTMESIRNGAGVMHGYSVVVDISEYIKRQNIIRQEIKQMEQNLEMMRINNSASQMQPHFLYNALSSIREVVLTDPEYASDLIYDFTVYLRACIKTMQSGDLISMDQELDNIRAYTNIEKMRMGDRLHVVFDIQAEDFKIAPLSIQPLVENAIRHGIFKRGMQGGTVTIKTETSLESNVIIIKDDGVGFDYQKVRNEVESGKRDSIGLDNAMFRLKKRLNADIMINSEIGKGTVVKISVPRERGQQNESHNS